MRKRFEEFASQIPANQQNPSTVDLEKWTKSVAIPNKLELPLFHTTITARSSNFTDVVRSVNKPEYLELIDKIFDFLSPNDYILQKMTIGQDEEIKLKATVIISKANASKVSMLQTNFFESSHKLGESDIITIDAPQFPERKVLVYPEDHMTFVLGIDYYGELKMSILRMAMEIMRRDKGGLGLHAGSKTFRLMNGVGKISEKGALIFGLSGTGKTTLTCHNHGLESPEGVLILQDDINLITSNGRSYGSEKGFYVKCDNCPEHEEITKAVLSQGSVLENVQIDNEGELQWKDFSHTHNTRAIIPRSALADTGDTIDLSSLDFIIYNTRRPELPPIGRLINAEQGAAYYGLGESIITSAEDASRAGESKRQVGFDPFILGDESININRMREIIEQNEKLQCFIVNTGYVGNEENDISVDTTLQCIEQAIRGKIKWEYDADLGFEIPNKIDTEKLNPRKFYGSQEFSQMMQALRDERKQYLSSFTGIEDSIIQSL